jgi:2-polyprenyl-3-methyl-5-hydroxy-6-metoxy-1,4-benzoquinol methylase
MATQAKLDCIASSLTEANDDSWSQDYYLLRYRMRVLLPRVRGPRVLELGCAEGGMTKVLAERFPNVVSVDGSPLLIERANQATASDNVTFYCSLFEDFEPNGKFSSILMSCILEHVHEPTSLLKRAREWLTQEGLIHIVVPNAEALNRRIGKAMGMLKRLEELHQRDLRMGHQRVYSRSTLAVDIEAAGLEVVRWDGIFLKPLSDAQIRDWDEKLLDAFFEIGKELPEYCTEIYAECRPRGAGRGT